MHRRRLHIVPCLLLALLARAATAQPSPAGKPPADASAGAAGEGAAAGGAGAAAGGGEGAAPGRGAGPASSGGAGANAAGAGAAPGGGAGAGAGGGAGANSGAGPASSGAAGEPGPGPASGPGPERPGEVIIVPPVDTRTSKPGDLVSPESGHGERERALGESGFTTVVRVDQRAGETLPLAEALAETVGVHVRSLGGLGSFSSLSVRGAPSGHTAVFVDGVPLARLGSATADLGRFELGTFSVVRLNRGAVPASLGGAVQASALELATELGPAADGHPLLLSVGGGSFGTRHARARWLGGTDGLAASSGYHLGLGYAGSEGDFVYFNDNGTNLNQSDDEYVARRNNGYDRADALARGEWRRGDWSVRGGVRGLWKRQGVLGSASVQSRTASLTTWSQIADAAAERAGAFGNPALSARAAAHALVELERYRDPSGEVGLGAQDRRYVTASGGGSWTVEAELARAHTSAATAEASVELFRDTALAVGDGDGDGERQRNRGLRLETAATLSHTFRLLGESGERARLQPALRVDLSRITPIADPDDGVQNLDLSPRTDVDLTPRLAAWVHAAADLSLKAGAGAYRRSPTSLELYGDRGALVGNPALAPETGESADLGLVWARERAAGPIDRIYVETAGFAARSRDTIVWVPTAGLVTGPRNLGRALVWGGELVASARAGRALTVTADYTYLDSRQRDTLPSYEGKELPQRPRHRLHGRADLAGRALDRLIVLFGDAALVSGNHLDPANLSRVPPRALFGAGLKLEIAPGLFAAVEGKNLADERVEDIPLDPPPRPDLTRTPRAISDFFGYPLPGRAFYLTLLWEP